MAEADSNKLDPVEVARLYIEHGDALRRFLVGLLRDSQRANDVLQATFAKLAERGHETRPGSRRAWLFRVAYHEAMHLRRREATGDKAVERLGWIKPTTPDSPDSRVIRAELVQMVRHAVKQLPKEQRRVVQMRIYEEKTFAVIAEELKIPLGTALARMRSALKKLRDKLDELRQP